MASEKEIEAAAKAISPGCNWDNGLTGHRKRQAIADAAAALYAAEAVRKEGEETSLDPNARAYREAVVRSCDERLTKQKHEIRSLRALLAEAKEALEAGLFPHPYWTGASTVLAKIEKALAE